jgi:hypothetical protein
MANSFVGDFLNAQSTKNWATVSVDYVSAAGDRLLVDTGLGELTIALPASPRVGDTVEFSDARDFSVLGNSLVVTSAPFQIHGESESLIVDTRNASFALTFTGVEWRLTES